MGLNARDKKEYVSILSSDGTIRQKVEEGTPGAVRRDWETKDDSGTKHELVYDDISGYIKGLEINEGNYGTEIRVLIDDIILTIAAGSSFGTDFMRKLPNINVIEEVTLNPYSFTPKGTDKIKKGMSITQGEDEDGKGIKILDFFYDGKKSLNGMPEKTKAEQEKMTKAKWQVYFIEVTEFLLEYTLENMPVFGDEEALPDAEKDGVQVDDLDMAGDKEETKE